MRYVDPDGLTEREGWQAGTVTNLSSQTIFIAADVGSVPTVIPLDSGEKSQDFFVDTDAIVVGEGQSIEGRTTGAFKLGSADVALVDGSGDGKLSMKRDGEYMILLLTGQAGYRTQEVAKTQGWIVPENMQEALKTKEKLKEDQKTRNAKVDDEEPEVE